MYIPGNRRSCPVRTAHDFASNSVYCCVGSIITAFMHITAVAFKMVCLIGHLADAGVSMDVIFEQLPSFRYRKLGFDHDRLNQISF